MIVSPCGVILQICEMVGSESVSQAWLGFFTLAAVTGKYARVCVYDAACRLGKFAANKVRTFYPVTTKTARAFTSQLTLKCDRLHVRNHVDADCMPGGIYHPDTGNELKTATGENISTQAAEQTMRWLNQSSGVYRTMGEHVGPVMLLAAAWTRNELHESRNPGGQVARAPAALDRVSEQYVLARRAEIEYLGVDIAALGVDEGDLRVSEQSKVESALMLAWRRLARWTGWADRREKIPSTSP